MGVVSHPKVINPFGRLRLGTTRATKTQIERPVYLPPDLRQYSVAVLGQPGSGKTTFLVAFALEHILRGEAIFLPDPHGDGVVRLVEHLTALGFFNHPEAAQRVVYIDASEAFPFDFLSLHPDPVAAASAFYEASLCVFPEMEQAPSYAEMMLSAAITLKANNLPITATLRLLRDQSFRDECLKRVDNEAVLEHFRIFNELGRDRLSEMGSTRRRAFALTVNPLLAQSLGQTTSVIQPRRFMDQGISLLLNLGNIEDDTTRRFIGALVMKAFEQAAKSRTDMPRLLRRLRPYTVLADEWNSYLARDNTIGIVIEECRKFELRIYLIGQTLAQVESDRLRAALGTCRTKICFNLDRDTAVAMARQIEPVDVYAVKETRSIPYQFDNSQYWRDENVYMDVAEQFEERSQLLQNLPDRWAYVKLPNQKPILFKTPNLPDPRPDPARLQQVLETFRARYQVSPAEAASLDEGPSEEPPAPRETDDGDDDAVFRWEAPE